MAVDDRDWHRDWWRKKLNHNERSSFRMSETAYRRKKTRRVLGRLFFQLVALVFTLYLLKNFGFPLLLTLFSRNL